MRRLRSEGSAFHFDDRYDQFWARPFRGLASATSARRVIDIYDSPRLGESHECRRLQHDGRAQQTSRTHQTRAETGDDAVDWSQIRGVVPFLSGRVEIWAAAIVYALGSINFLFDSSFLSHAPPDTICDYFQVSKRTVAQKAKLIRDMFKLGYFDSEFSAERMTKNNPLSRLRMVNGFLVIDEPLFRDSD